MYIISNRQRDDILRYIEILCKCLPTKGTKAINTRRLAMNLHKALEAKQPLSKEELTARLKFPADLK